MVDCTCYFWGEYLLYHYDHDETLMMSILTRNTMITNVIITNATAKLTNPNQDRVNMAESLFGIIPADITLEEARAERLSKI